MVPSSQSLKKDVEEALVVPPGKDTMPNLQMRRSHCIDILSNKLADVILSRGNL